MGHHYFDVRAITATEADGSNAFATVQKIVIDSKAMRKFGSEQILFGSLDVTETGTSVMRLQAETRVLLKL